MFFLGFLSAKIISGSYFVLNEAISAKIPFTAKPFFGGRVFGVCGLTRNNVPLTRPYSSSSCSLIDSVFVFMPSTYFRSLLPIL